MTTERNWSRPSPAKRWRAELLQLAAVLGVVRLLGGGLNGLIVLVVGGVRMPVISPWSWMVSEARGRCMSPLDPLRRVRLEAFASVTLWRHFLSVA